MGWSTTSVSKVYTPEELLKKETTWYSSYNEPERWIQDLKTWHYNLVGEFEIEKNLVLYRFELDETHRADSFLGASHYQNVIIQTNLPQVILSETPQLLNKKRSY